MSIIRRVRVQNFESHKDTELKFGPGLNLIRGKSNSGKSSIMRAVALVAYHQWDKKMLRNDGAEFAEVEVESDRGVVNAKCGEKINTWVVNEKMPDGTMKEFIYDKVGKEGNLPPKVLEILGMPRMDMGDVVDLPNFMFQLEKHYMLDEVNGKKCSSNMVARIMDRVIGLGGMEDLIKDMSSDGTKNKRKLNDNDSHISELKSKMHLQDHIDGLEKKAKGCRYRIDELTEKKKRLDAIQKLKTEAADLAKRLKEVREKLAGKKDIVSLKAQLEAVKSSVERHSNLSSLVVSIKQAKSSLETVRGKLAKIPDLTLLKTELVTLQDKESRRSKLVESRNELIYKKGALKDVSAKLLALPNVDNAKIELEILKGKMERLSGIKLLQSELSTLAKKSLTFRSRIAKADSAHAVAVAAKKKFYIDNPLCPVCNRPWDESVCKEV